MKNLRRIAVAGAAVLVISAVSLSAFAASSYTTPAEAAAGLTGKTVERVIKEKTESGKTYGEIANDAGKLAEFKAEILAMKKDMLAKRVAAGTLPQERADEIIAAMEANQADCDGTGSGGAGHGSGVGFGNGTGNGLGRGKGQGRMNGQGKGLGLAGCNLETSSVSA